MLESSYFTGTKTGSAPVENSGKRGIGGCSVLTPAGDWKVTVAAEPRDEPLTDDVTALSSLLIPRLVSLVYELSPEGVRTLAFNMVEAKPDSGLVICL
jgi:hypothetical protein